jgi:SAM-dependent methyltransferase
MPSYDLARCVICGSAESEAVADADDMRAESEMLWEYHMRRLSPRTPPDRLVDRVAFSQAPPWRLVRCPRCDLLYRNPAEKREALTATYRDAEPSRDSLQALHDAQRATYRAQARRLHRVMGRRGSGLEIGSYVGAFLAAARESRWSFEGLDINPHVNAFTRSLGFAVHDGELESFRPDRAFDALAIWNTFDQLPDPANAVRAAKRLLAPGGLLAIRVPNGACYRRWRARLRARRLVRAAAVALLAQNNLLTFPYRFGFSPASLTRLLVQEGFTVRLVTGDVLVPTADEYTRPAAALEERVVKRLTRFWMPWFEVYATTSSSTP